LTYEIDDADLDDLNDVLSKRDRPGLRYQFHLPCFANSAEQILHRTDVSSPIATMIRKWVTEESFSKA
jgi:hypothetical protein